MKKILVLCTGNSCRSQIAEGYLRHFAGNRAEVYSAGIETHGLNPGAVQTMLSDSIDISGHRSKNVSELEHLDFDYVITVCDHARDNCPYMPAKIENIHMPFPDPAKATGTEEELKEEFARVRDMIKSFSKKFVEEKLEKVYR